MNTVSPQELAAFERDAEAWFAEHMPQDPGFQLPLTFMEVGTDAQFDFLRDWQRKVWEAGFIGLSWPEAYGGRGLDPAFQAVADRVMRRHDAPILLNAIGLNWAGPLILDLGTDAQKAAYLKPILSAEEIWCQGFSEPDNGSDLGNAQLRAVRDGEDYVLNGSKIWTTLAEHAEHMILLARTNPDAPNKYAGLSFFLSPMKVEGISVTKIQKLTGEYGFCQVYFSDARIPASALMGGEGGGWKMAMRTLEYERGARPGQAGGYSIKDRDGFDIVRLAKSLLRDGEAVADNPVLRDQLVDLVIELQANALCHQRQAITRLNLDFPTGLPLSSKLRFSELQRRLNAFAVTMTGPEAAYYVGDPSAVDDGLWARSYLNAFSATIGGGTSEIQRNIIGEHVLGLAKS